MHINSSGENYLETILILSKKRPVVRSVDIATEFQTYKVDSFYDPSVFYIQTGNNSLCKHHIHLL